MNRFKPVLIALVLVLTASAVFAQEAATTTAPGNGVRWGVLAAAFVLGIAAAAGPARGWRRRGAGGGVGGRGLTRARTQGAAT